MEHTEIEHTEIEKSNDISSDIRARAKRIKLLVLDVDGVLTDGRLYFDANGVEIKSFDSQDGHGIKMLRQTGVEVAIITGRTSKIVEIRSANLGITQLIQGREDKKVALMEMTKNQNICADQIAYVGDDLPDLPAIRYTGLGIAVANAHAFVKANANWTTDNSGGRGAVREVCDFIMDSQDNLDKALQEYL